MGVQIPSTADAGETGDAGNIEVFDCKAKKRRIAPFSVLSEFRSGLVSDDGTRFARSECGHPWPTNAHVAWITIYDSRSGRALRRVERENANPVGQFARAPSGPLQYFVGFSTSRDRAANGWHLYDAESGELIAQRATPDGILSVAMTRDGTRIVTGGRDRTLRFWDAKTYDELVRLRGHDAYLYRVVCGPRGRKIVSCSGDYTLRVWDTEPLRETLRARRR